MELHTSLSYSWPFQPEGSATLGMGALDDVGFCCYYLPIVLTQNVQDGHSTVSLDVNPRILASRNWYTSAGHRMYVLQSQMRR
jgi:hypothetical protein